MEFLTVPFEASFVFRALLAGSLAAVLCAGIGTWVVLRGLTFFGDAMSHGMLPGVAIAALLGGNLMIGAAASALVISFGVVAVSRSSRLSQDVSIGLQFITMLSLGVVIVSHSGSFAVDLTAFLFGDILGVAWNDVLIIGAATIAGVLACWILHRPFTALTFDERKAHTLGMRPGLTHIGMLALVALATVTSFQVVGTLLVFGLLIGPPATALLMVQGIGRAMTVAAAIGMAQVYVGLLISWYAETAAGATITLLSGVTFLSILAAKALLCRVRLHTVNDNDFQ
ncbi:zinc ABC transporter permease AztB [Corynebacterium alimapuense]|uniref:ABC transporter permease n=1 Tax=Corynebacterium alimapuense TaxID=1576874 RepID=A0A3M8K6U7_9CORY|nr:zinc ABC transporter permease AztB [Corynebacterium alimapuense]RNE48234.1 ABC transporter permease [Corynebacterium alimapuense]